MSRPSCLTKSRYKLAVECPRKLFYTGKPDYANNKSEDTFLLALADAGFQVGELAKHYFPGGVEVPNGHKDKEAAVAYTQELLERDNVIIFEAAFRHRDLYVLVDILHKQGDVVRLIEVKSKSWKRGVDLINTVIGKKGGSKGRVISEWAPYMNDVAFQHYVVSKANPRFKVSPWLMMVDKTAIAPVDGLNQKFRITKDDCGYARVDVDGPLTEEHLQPSLLVEVDVSPVVDIIRGHAQGPGEMDLNFEEELLHFMRVYQEDIKPLPRLDSKCGKCEFRCNDQQRTAGLKDGFRECWTEVLGWQDDDFQAGSVLDIWNPRAKLIDGLVANGKFKIADVSPENIAPKYPKSNDKPGLTQAERRELALAMAKGEERDDYFDSVGFQAEHSQWRYPLHFIDFETSSEAIPFFQDSRPNDPVIFQYSHHILREDGRIEHAGQYLDAEPGSYPSFRLLRRLKAELEQDEGTIFRYHNHENTCLAKLYELLMEHGHLVKDAEELKAFILSITKSTNSSSSKWEGERSMVDLCNVCERFYVPVACKGRTSLKVILPAILNGSGFLKGKYGKPIYGGPAGGVQQLPSLNFQDTPVTWVQAEPNGAVRDPYSLLAPLFDDFSEAELEEIENSEPGKSIAEGGAAMVAYRRLQLTEISDSEREAVKAALLKYCELDTLAMVMLVEGWLSVHNSS